jgi:uncharacterized protein DUF4261
LCVALGLVLLGAREVRAGAPAPKATSMNVAFVLLSEAKLPKGEDVERAFASFATKGQTLRRQPAKAKKPGGGDALELDTGGGGYAIVALMPAPVPNREADEAVRFSVSALGGRWKLPPHKAHLVVTAHGTGDRAESLSAFTSLVAAVVEASPSVGVYLGAAGATHDPKFFRDIARERDASSRLVLWSGVSIARGDDGRLSFLSLGMKQLDLPDVLLVVPSKNADDALSTLFDLIGYEVLHGALPEGDTFGRTATEKLPVHYAPSPVDPKAKVWRVDLK